MPPPSPPQEQQHEPRRPRHEGRPTPPTAAAATAMAHSDDMAAFYEAWVEREERIAADLAAALPSRRADALAALVDAALRHVASYYEHKSRLADRDVVAALDPRWLNPLERTFLWAWGWKPALVFRFVDASASTGAAAAPALEELRAATAAAEREVDREVAAAQESLAGPRVLAALRRQAPAARNGGGEAANADEAVAAVGRSLRVLLAAADALRQRTLRAVVEALPPEQAAAALAAMLRFHIGVRRAGRDWNASPGQGGGGRRRGH